MGNVELFLALAFASLASVGAIGFIIFQQPVHAALSFAVTVLSGAGLYLLLDAPYAAVATVIVYAGATIIMFLFALMFAQGRHFKLMMRTKPIRSVRLLRPPH
jgi:NADH-quinone oxidoreductase subunit J